ncbi:MULTISPECIES: zinc-dependent metalloprotease [unclassified Corynebacterium]|uniref:zinc-dependent metalloprotease n=1 Tax=unclassified Corynebacterium TaxID=2624378 RepID=UPI0029CA4C91|nr:MULTISPECIES: zinc-dependent metalloprotease [unclassified Corynebacterium]WPF66668.1 zinc-dependent metalloprotease [Corynebacterium sp. 22KM0430]WPF69156.1 zinc-dependent metalloprotease [Corynebacterium sp. 21KM1197]
MNNGGFGFSFGNSGDDDDENKRRGDNNPFGAFGFSGGGLGDILNQFGSMLSGMGSSMNSPEGAGPVNYDLAQRIARQQLGGQPQSVPQKEAEAVRESARLAELWLGDATVLPAAQATVESWTPENWLDKTMPMWKRMVTPVAENMNQAQLDSLPEEARQMMGPMSQMMKQMSGMNFGMQLGHALGDLAGQALTGSDFGMPVAPAGVTAVLPTTIESVAKDLNVAPQEVLMYICAREVARQRLFQHVPWLVERLVSSVEEYAQGLVIDTSHIEEAARGLNLESGDPQAIQDAMRQLQDMDMSPKISSRNAGAVSRLETLLALVEGWVEYVVTQAMGERIPSTSAMNEAWRRRRATGGSAEQAFAKVVGIEFAAPKVSEAMELWRRVDAAVGMERRDRVWDHPDFLPTAEDLDNSAEFIDGLLDEGGVHGFDPISEIEELEKRLAEEDKGSEEDKGDKEN